VSVLFPHPLSPVSKVTPEPRHFNIDAPNAWQVFNAENRTALILGFDLDSILCFFSLSKPSFTAEFIALSISG
jgi:hypothetical protein